MLAIDELQWRELVGAPTHREYGKGNSNPRNRHLVDPSSPQRRPLWQNLTSLELWVCALWSFPGSDAGPSLGSGVGR
jgi:hypothetical protein